MALFVGALWPAAYSFLGDLIAADDAVQRKSWVLSFPSFSQFPSYFSDGGTTYSLPLKASLHGRRQNGIIVVVGGAIALLFTLAMFLGSGLMWFSLGTLTYTTLYDSLMS